MINHLDLPDQDDHVVKRGRKAPSSGLMQRWVHALPYRRGEQCGYMQAGDDHVGEKRAIPTTQSAQANSVTPPEEKSLVVPS
jgi:hypothetical protein